MTRNRKTCPVRSVEQRIALSWVPACATSASDHILSPASFSASRRRGRGGSQGGDGTVDVSGRPTKPAGSPGKRRGASQGRCEGAGSEQPCPRHRSGGQEAGEGAEDPAAGHQPQTRTGNEARGGGGTAPGAAAEASPRRGERRAERCSGSSRAPGGALLQRTGAPAQVYSGWPARVHTHTRSHSPPQPPGAMPAAPPSLGGI